MSVRAVADISNPRTGAAPLADILGIILGLPISIITLTDMCFYSNVPLMLKALNVTFTSAFMSGRKCLRLLFIEQNSDKSIHPSLMFNLILS